MAIIPSANYPAQTDADAAYPHGKARNAAAYQDGTGTPLEKTWVNDLWGFLQALLAGGGITPSGDPDEVGASQYLEALLALFQIKFGVYYFETVTPVTDLNRIPLTVGAQRGGFSVASGHTAVVPGAGNYLVFVSGNFKSADNTDPTLMTISLEGTGQSGITASLTRHSTNVNEQVNLSVIAPTTGNAYVRVFGEALSAIGYMIIIKV